MGGKSSKTVSIGAAYGTRYLFADHPVDDLMNLVTELYNEGDSDNLFALLTVNVNARVYFFYMLFSRMLDPQVFLEFDLTNVPFAYVVAAYFLSGVSYEEEEPFTSGVFGSVARAQMRADITPNMFIAKTMKIKNYNAVRAEFDGVFATSWLEQAGYAVGFPVYGGRRLTEQGDHVMYTSFNGESWSSVWKEQKTEMFETVSGTSVCIQASMALGAAHTQAGVLHMDMHFENVLLSEGYQDITYIVGSQSYHRFPKRFGTIQNPTLSDAVEQQALQDIQLTTTYVTSVEVDGNVFGLPSHGTLNCAGVRVSVIDWSMLEDLANLAYTNADMLVKGMLKFNTFANRQINFYAEAEERYNYVQRIVDQIMLTLGPDAELREDYIVKVLTGIPEEYTYPWFDRFKELKSYHWLPDVPMALVDHWRIWFTARIVGEGMEEAYSVLREIEAWMLVMAHRSFSILTTELDTNGPESAQEALTQHLMWREREFLWLQSLVMLYCTERDDIAENTDVVTLPLVQNIQFLDRTRELIDVTRIGERLSVAKKRRELPDNVDTVPYTEIDDETLQRVIDDVLGEL